MTTTYKYDSRGNMTTNGRSTFLWDNANHLIQTIFPDGEGARYTYDAMGRRITKTTFSAQGEGLHTTKYEYEGSGWNVSRERNKDGDVVALTDSTGAVKARYEYDEWGRIFALYDETGRVKEGYGTIGDIGTGPARPVIGSPTPGSTKGKKGKDSPATLSEPDPATGDVALPAEDEGELQIQGVIGEPTDLVKMNPYRYGGYRYDRETQYYYLRARNYDGRLARFLSQDTRMGDVRNPLTLNRYIYAVGNPVNYLDPTGHAPQISDPANNRKAPPDLNERDKEAVILQHNFTNDAVKYYGVERLWAAVNQQVPVEIVVKANKIAQDGIKLGKTLDDVVSPESWDPLVRFVEFGWTGNDIPEGTVAWDPASAAGPTSFFPVQYKATDPYGISYGFSAPDADAARPGMSREERALAVCRKAAKTDSKFYSPGYDEPCKAIIFTLGTQQEKSMLAYRQGAFDSTTGKTDPWEALVWSIPVMAMSLDSMMSPPVGMGSASRPQVMRSMAPKEGEESSAFGNLQLFAAPKTVKGRLKAAQLPTEGKIRFVPPKDWTPSQGLIRTGDGGYVDRFGNIWTRGPSRTAGEPFQWDVQLGPHATPGMRMLSRDGRHVNVSLQGRITH